MKLLLHYCCGPCGVYPTEVLQEKNLDFEGYFFNPNIHPMEEFNRRKETLKTFAEIANVKIHYKDTFMQEDWEKYQKEDSSRCTMCYDIRMEEVADFAQKNGFDTFSTTLLVSPYQNHDYIIETANKAAKKFKIAFYYEDFRPGFRLGQQKAKEMGLYRQKYCGCILSKA